MTTSDQSGPVKSDLPAGMLVTAITGGTAYALAQEQSAEQEAADMSEAAAILHRLDRELVVEEALTRELMIRHGL